MKKGSVVGIIISAIIYLFLYPLAAACGLIHPACYAYVGSVVPILFVFVYLNASSKMKCFGAALCLNLNFQ